MTPVFHLQRGATVLGGLALLYLVIAYGIMPAFWSAYVRRHPVLAQAPRTSTLSDGLPGDPLNVALVGSEDDVLRIMRAGGWDLAARLGVRADLRIAADSVLGRPDRQAPVSTQYLFGRPEDLAFEQEVGGNPRHRHHVRFWKTEEVGTVARPVWIGAAIYDRSLGLDASTGQITHAVDPDVDAERDFLFTGLARTGELLEQESLDGYHAVREGRNGAGATWHTDGRLFIGFVTPQAPAPPSSAPRGPS